MNNQTETFSDDALNSDLIKGDWIDVKLCTVMANKRSQLISSAKTKKNQSICNEEIAAQVPFYNELHYGNYE